MQATMLEIKLLGPVNISYQGEPIHIKRKMERAILYYLAGEHKPISRTALIDLLWPKAEQIDPRAALRTALSRLRRALPEPDRLVTELDQVSLDLDRCEIDVLRFEIYHTSLRRFLSAHAEDKPLPEQIVSQMQQAIALWRGDDFIQGDDLSSYPEIENWHQLRHRLLSHQCKFLKRRLADHYLAAGQLELALVSFIALGRIDLADTAIHLAVVDILTKLGRYQDAIDYCDGLESRYEREYNTPLPGSIIDCCQYAHLLIDTAKTQEKKRWPIPLTMHLQLIGRETELDRLKGAFNRGGLVLVKGEMGTGKTRLVKELYETLTPTPKLLIAPSRERESALPFAPIVHCLRHDIPQEIWQKVDLIWANQLSLLLPELADIRGDLDRTIVSKLPLRKQHLFDAILHTFKMVTKLFGRLLFFLDDAQWVDQQTLLVLKYLVLHGLFDEHGLLVIATRPEEANRDLDELIDQLHRSYHIELITLKGLNPIQLSHLVTQVLDGPPSPVFNDQLFRETNGNPFIALEIIRNLEKLPYTKEQIDSQKSLPLPENVHGVIRRRLNLLDADSRRILQCAAVLGEDVSLSVLENMTGLNIQWDVNKIEALANSGFITLLEMENPLQSIIHFPHEKMREVVLKETSPLRLKLLHQQAAQVLAQDKRSITKSAVIAEHYLSSGDVYQAFHWYLKAADYAWDLGAKKDAEQSFRKAEEIFLNDSEGLFSNDDIIALYEQWSQFAYLTYQVELLEETGIKLQVLGEQINNLLFLGISKIVLADACFLRFQFDIGLEMIEQAILNLNLTHNHLALIQAYTRQCRFYWWKLQFERTLKAANQVLTISNEIEELTPSLISLVFYANHSICMVYYAQGEAKKCLDLANEIHKNYMHKLDPLDRLRVLYLFGYAHLISANYEQCRTFNHQALNLSRELGRVFVEQSILYVISKAEVIQGHLDEAYQYSMRALQIGEEKNHAHTIVTANRILGDIFYYLGNINRALQYYRTAQIREGFSINSLHGIENNVHLAHVLAQSGRFNEARELNRITIQLTQKNKMIQFLSLSLLVEVECDLMEGHFVDAEKSLLSAENLLKDRGLRFESLFANLARAQLASAKGNQGTAIQLLEKIVIDSQTLGVSWITLEALQSLAQHKQKDTNLKLNIDIGNVYHDLIHELEAHAQSDPIKEYFQIAKESWDIKLLTP